MSPYKISIDHLLTLQSCAGPSCSGPGCSRTGQAGSKTASQATGG
jgi:hypothetical protein